MRCTDRSELRGDEVPELGHKTTVDSTGLPKRLHQRDATAVRQLEKWHKCHRPDSEREHSAHQRISIRRVRLCCCSAGGKRAVTLGGWQLHDVMNVVAQLVRRASAGNELEQRGRDGAVYC